MWSPSPRILFLERFDQFSTLKRILRCSRGLFIILVSKTLFSEKILISTSCIHGFMLGVFKSFYVQLDQQILDGIYFCSLNTTNMVPDVAVEYVDFPINYETRHEVKYISQRCS